MQNFCLIRDRIASISGSLQRWAENEPKLQHFCQPIIAWLNGSISSGDFPSHTEAAENVREGSERKIIELLLLTAQGIRSKGQGLSKVEELEGSALASATLFADLSTALSLEQVVVQVQSFLSDIKDSSPKQRLAAVQSVTPFFDAYLQLVDPMLRLQASYVKASGKLTYILSRLILSIIQKGFCKPPEAEDQQTDESSGERLQDGTGFGEGTGKEDVGHEIGDESQIEGLRDDAKDTQGDSGETRESEGMEMDGIDGETQDVDGNESESESEADEPQSDVENVVENLDKETSGQIDEKLWEGEQEDDDKQEKDQAGKDSKAAGEDIAPKTSESSKNSEPLAEETAKDDSAPDADNPPDGEDAPPIDAGKQLENTVSEESVLDLPDDMTLNQSEGGDSADDLEDMVGDEDTEVDEIASQLDAQSIAEGGPDEEGSDVNNDDKTILQNDSQEDAPNVEDTAEGTMEDSSKGNQGAAPKQDSSKDASMMDDPMNALEATDVAADSLKDDIDVGNEGLDQGYVLNAQCHAVLSYIYKD